MYDPVPGNSVFFFSALRVDKCTRRGRALLCESSQESERKERELPTRGTNRLMMIGQFHTRWLVWYRPSSVITLFITCRASRALFNGGGSPSGTENVDPDKILPRCWLDRSAVLSPILPMNTSLISRIIRADIRAPINRAEKFMRERYTTYNCRNACGWNARRWVAGICLRSIFAKRKRRSVSANSGIDLR